jgi:hypothetical protein
MVEGRSMVSLRSSSIPDDELELGPEARSTEAVVLPLLLAAAAAAAAASSDLCPLAQSADPATARLPPTTFPTSASR